MNARIPALLALLALAASLVPLGCTDQRLPAKLIADLHSLDSRDRVSAAHTLRTRGAMPPEAVPALIQALRIEQGKVARREEILALAVSGAPQAEPLICDAIYDRDADVRGWGKEALVIWLPMNPSSRGCPPTH